MQLLNQLSYCPLIWMFCTRESNYRLKRVHGRALRLLNGKTIHQRCINVLMTEVLKYLDGLLPGLMSEVFRLK